MDVSGIVTEIERYSIHDGPGIRTVVFLKGCPIRCKWCCNPETFTPRIEMGYFKDKCLLSRRCVKACPYGAISYDHELGLSTNRSVCEKMCFGVTESFPCTKHCYSGARRNLGIRMTIDEVLTEVEKDRQLYDRSGGGVTLSGGEISYQPEFASCLLSELKNRWINTAIETNGVGRPQFYHEIAPDLDFVFLDIKTLSDEKHRHWIGSSNEIVLSNAIELSRLGSKYGFTLVVRTPVVPGFNDTPEDINAIAEFVSTRLPSVTGIELLPYHKLGRGKYQSIGREYQLEGLVPPQKESMEELESVVRGLGLQVINY